jgi:methylenetetrahydrofolate reductase (NADPH)
LGIKAPIIPGLKILTSRAHLTSVPKNFYISIPDELSDEVINAKPEHALDIGVEWAAKQVEALLNSNVPGVHFYVMQNSKPIIKLMNRLRL